MENLCLETVLSAERQALAMGSAHVVALREAAQRWLVDQANGLLVFEEGVAEVVDRLAPGGSIS